MQSGGDLGPPPCLLPQTEAVSGISTPGDRFLFHSLSCSQQPAPTGPCFSPAREHSTAAHCLPTTSRLFKLSLGTLPRRLLLFHFISSSLLSLTTHKPPASATSGSPIFPQRLPNLYTFRPPAQALPSALYSIFSLTFWRTLTKPSRSTPNGAFLVTSARSQPPPSVCALTCFIHLWTGKPTAAPMETQDITAKRAVRNHGVLVLLFSSRIFCSNKIFIWNSNI